MRSQRKTWLLVGGVGELDVGTGKDQVDFGHWAKPSSLDPMRLGVLDIGSNTGHLLVVDAHGGAAPAAGLLPQAAAAAGRAPRRDGAVTETGIDALTDFCRRGRAGRRGQGLRGDARLRHLGGARRGQLRRGARPRRRRDRVDLEVLSGEDEARLTFLAVRRWFGWSAGRLAVFDIGGGSLEIAGGADEAPDVAWSLPLGAARMARDVVRRRPARRRRRSASCASRSAPRSPATPATCCAPVRPTGRRRPRRPSARWRASAAPRRAATARSCPRVLELDDALGSGSPS